MNQEDCLAEFEAQLGVALPDDYRLFLMTHADQVLEEDLVFDVPNGPWGMFNYLFTACDLVARSNAERLGDPSRGMMCIGSDQQGGYVYMCVRDEWFGRIYCETANGYEEVAASFGGFLAISSPLEDDHAPGAHSGGHSEMAVPTSSLFAGSIAALISVAVLTLRAFLLAGPSHFGGLLSNSVWYILGISLVAGVVRVLFRRGGLVLSVVCGVLVAVGGYMLVEALATSRI